MKSEPDVYGIMDLERDGKTHWDGVRNYQARNLIRDEMRPGDRVLFYHSNAEPTGVAGLAEVVSPAYPDHTAWDKRSEHHDPRSTPETPVWFMVDVAFVTRFPRVITLPELKADPALTGMLVAQRGQRLSVQPVEKAHYERIVRLAKRP